MVIFLNNCLTLNKGLIETFMYKKLTKDQPVPNSYLALNILYKTFMDLHQMINFKTFVDKTWTVLWEYYFDVSDVFKNLCEDNNLVNKKYFNKFSFINSATGLKVGTQDEFYPPDTRKMFTTQESMMPEKDPGSKNDLMSFLLTKKGSGSGSGESPNLTSSNRLEKSVAFQTKASGLMHSSERSDLTKSHNFLKPTPVIPLNTLADSIVIPIPEDPRNKAGVITEESDELVGSEILSEQETPKDNSKGLFTSFQDTLAPIRLPTSGEDVYEGSKIIVDLKNKIMGMLVYVIDSNKPHFNEFKNSHEPVKERYPGLYHTLTREFDVLIEFINGPCLDNQKLLLVNFADGDIDLITGLIKIKRNKFEPALNNLQIRACEFLISFIEGNDNECVNYLCDH
jgi:hypothetical protein